MSSLSEDDSSLEGSLGYASHDSPTAGEVVVQSR